MLTTSEERKLVARLSTLTVEELCACAYKGHVKYVADRLLELCEGSKAQALRKYCEYARKIHPGFTVRGEGTSKGGAMYDAQRQYNNLDYHYRKKMEARQNVCLDLHTRLDIFLTKGREEASINWIKLLLDAMTDREIQELKAEIKARGSSRWERGH